MYSYTRFCAQNAQLALKSVWLLGIVYERFFNCQKQAFKMVDQNRAMHRPLYYIDFDMDACIKPW